MKTKLIVMITALFLSHMAMNANNGTGESTESQIQKQLSIQPLNTAAPKNTDIKVEVLFTTDVNGKVDLAIANTNDQTLKKEIEKNFMKLTLKDTKPNVCYSITLKLITI